MPYINASQWASSTIIFPMQVLQKERMQVKCKSKRSENPLFIRISTNLLVLWGGRGRGFKSRYSDHESPQSMIQSAEDFLILPMKKPCNQGKSGTQGVRISSGVPLFSFCGINTPSGKICNLHPPPVPREGKLKGWGNRWKVVTSLTGHFPSHGGSSHLGFSRKSIRLRFSL